MNLTVIIILLVGLVISAAMCILTSSLIKAGIVMAVTSAILSIIMFVLSAPLAAVFELSVCAGLITVIFISTISMTKIMSKEEFEEKKKARVKRFVLLPVLLVVLLAAMLIILWPHIDTSVSSAIAGSGISVQDVLWGKRQVDLLGQIVIILTGVYGVIIFFREGDTK